MEKSKNSRSSRVQSGFTLIEVLLAGFILILVISAMTFIYQTAVLSSSKAENSVKLSGAVGLIMANIQSQIRSNNATESLSGQGEIADVSYQWQSSLLQNDGPPARFDADDGNFKDQEDRFFLWQVDLTVNSKLHTKHYQFKEISWRSY